MIFDPEFRSRVSSMACLAPLSGRNHFSFKIRKIRAESRRAAYTEYLDLEDTLTARYAFAIERFPERRQACCTVRHHKLCLSSPKTAGSGDGRPVSPVRRFACDGSPMRLLTTILCQSAHNAGDRYVRN